MNLVLVILSFLTALIPIADRGIQTYQARQVQAQTAMKPVLAPTPPEAGQLGVVFHQGEWWRNVDGQWFVWRQTQLAQGGSNVVR